MNLSALSPTVIESELFGHVAGAFTGATSKRTGWFGRCAKHETLFLDEIGELDQNTQVKLLRMLETRRYQRLGDTKDNEFLGKLVSATNRDLAEETSVGRFRQDFYYRLCADIITTPSLRDQINDRPKDLYDLILFIAYREIGKDHAEELADKVQRWIIDELNPEYGWPGNIRELEQCVRNIMIRGTYCPMPSERKQKDGISQGLVEAYSRELTVKGLDGQYCQVLYEECDRNISKAAKIAGMDRRTFKNYLDIPDLDEDDYVERDERRPRPR